MKLEWSRVKTNSFSSLSPAEIATIRDTTNMQNQIEPLDAIAAAKREQERALESYFESVCEVLDFWVA